MTFTPKMVHDAMLQVLPKSPSMPRSQLNSDVVTFLNAEAVRSCIFRRVGNILAVYGSLRDAGRSAAVQIVKGRLSYWHDVNEAKATDMELSHIEDC